MASAELQRAVNGYNNYIEAHNGLADVQAINAYVEAVRVAIKQEGDIEYGLKLSKQVKELIETRLSYLKGYTIWDLQKFCYDNKTEVTELTYYFDLLLMEAQNKQFGSYMRYLEKDRNPKEQFYMPKRKAFNRFQIVDALQGLVDDRYDIVLISLIPGAGKTTIEKFFISALIGWFPIDYNLFYSHSSDIARMFYDGVYDIVTNNLEYRWNDIFPSLEVTNTNAKMQQFNIGKYKPFPSLQCTSIGSENAGKVRASKLLCVDDTIGKLEDALNKNTLNKIWGAYTVDARQRKVESVDGIPCKELHSATRWATLDVLGRLLAIYGENNPRVKVIAVPDVDPVTGRSNFDYEYGGFTVKFFDDQRLLMDDISYRCLYKQEPIERDGLLYQDEELRRYVELPLREPDAVIGVCDTKSKGVDYMVLPVMYQYDDDYYMVDCFCNDDTNFDIQYGRIANMMLDHNMQQCEFESNAGGDRVAYEIESRLKQLGGRCNITTKATETNKETRIIVNSDWIKRHVLFKDKELYSPKDDYGVFMNFLVSYTTKGRNNHDDVVDCMANFALFVTRRRNVHKASISGSWI